MPSIVAGPVATIPRTVVTTATGDGGAPRAADPAAKFGGGGLA